MTQATGVERAMQVRFLDLKVQYQSIKPEIDAAIANVIENTAFILGPAVKAFEEDFARFCGVKHCIAVSSGTTALQMAFLAAEIGSGDEVITAANTFIATCEAISHVGARPVLVDCDAATYNIDPNLIEAAITKRTKAIVPVHLYGRPAPMDAINRIAAKHGLTVIEDAAQAHGAKYQGAPAGSFGQAACFSFYPGKNLGAYGEGGAVVTDDDALAERARLLRDHGSAKKYHHDVIGYNCRMEGIQGAVLGVKLRHLPDWNVRRRSRADKYRQVLSGIPLVLPPVDDGCESVYHLFVIQVEEREHVMASLKEAGIDSLIHYPIPVHKQPAYAAAGWPEFPVTERAADRIVSLPMYAELSDEQIDYVGEALGQILGA